MIKTNLLPPELQKKKAKPKGGRAAASGPSGQVPFPAIALGLFLVLVAIDGYSAYRLYAQVADANKAALDAQDALAKAKKSYEEQKKEAEEKFRKWSLLKEKKEILSVLMPKDRILWTEKLNMIADLIPVGVYITGVEVTEKIVPEPTDEWLAADAEWKKKKAEADAKKTTPTVGPQEKLGPEPPKVSKPKITQTLIVNALALWGEGDMARLDKVFEFQKNMQAYETKNEKGEVRRFRDGFDQETDGKLIIQPGLQEKKVIDGVPVWQFQLTLVTQPFTPSAIAPSPAPAPAPAAAAAASK